MPPLPPPRDDFGRNRCRGPAGEMRPRRRRWWADEHEDKTQTEMSAGGRWDEHAHHPVLTAMSTATRGTNTHPAWERGSQKRAREGGGDKTQTEMSAGGRWDT